MTRPPRLAVRLLRSRLPRYWRDFVVGDLIEEFEARAAVSPARARHWFWWQALRCAARPPRKPSHVDIPVASGDPLVRTLAADLRYAVRVLLRAPSFTLAVAGVLALGIGANTAIFSIVHSVLLRPLPFENPDGLVRLYHTPPQSTFPGMAIFALSPANFYDWQRAARTFDRMAMFRARTFALTGGGEPESVVAAAVGPGFFQILGMRPAMGRVFLDEEDEPGRSRVVIVSEGFWKRRLGGRSDAIGSTLVLNGEPFTVVGVMPQVRSWFVTARDLFVPIALQGDSKTTRENHNQQAIARLAPGTTLAEAQAELDVISRRLEQEYPKENAGWGALVVPLHEDLVGDSRPSLLVLLAAVALVLLIACANVGNLLFARALSRRKELAIRAALGAGRLRVFQQLLVEALLLAMVGGVAGLIVARAGLAAARTLLADRLPRAEDIAIDTTVLLFVAGVSLLTGVLAGALPALRAGRTDLNDSLKEGGRNEGAVGVRTRRLLVVCEVALSLVLLMGASVMVRSLLALRNVDTGFDPQHVLTFSVALPAARYTPETAPRFFERALAQVRALPGVEFAGGVDSLPTQGGSTQPIVLEGRPEQLPRDQPTVGVRKITPGYLQALRIPVLRGRDVAESDVQVMLVSRSAAKLLWGDEDPIGRRVTLPLQSRMVYKTVIGVVGDVKQDDLDGVAGPCVYEYTRDSGQMRMAVAVRTAGDPAALTPAAVGVIRALDSQLPVLEPQTLAFMLDETLAPQRFNAMLLALFASAALALASIGIYSVLSYIVRGRSREIGIRTALGAQTGDVLRLVVLEGMTPALWGIGLGAIAALSVASVLNRLVYGVSASDPLMLAMVAAALAAVALVASLVPAWRASRLDPLTVLRDA